jgi:hypothetical protein
MSPAPIDITAELMEILAYVTGGPIEADYAEGYYYLHGAPSIMFRAPIAPIPEQRKAAD